VIRNFIHLETDTQVRDIQGGERLHHLLGCNIA